MIDVPEGRCRPREGRLDESPVFSIRVASAIVFVAILSCASAAAEQATDTSPGPERVSIRGELKRAAQDSGALLRAPAKWDKHDWRRAAAFVVTLGALFAEDNRVSDEVQSRRTATTDRIASRTDWFGQPGAVVLSGALLGAGLIRGNDAVRDTGRDALEASLLTVVEVGVIKSIAGRERPRDSGGFTRFKPFSSNNSFPSGHAAQVFAVAAVIAEHSNGWLVPTVAYSIATIVAVDRVAQNTHFASDVFAGAVIGGVTGKFLVRRHRRDRDPQVASRAEPRFTLGVVPIRGGAALTISYLE